MHKCCDSEYCPFPEALLNEKTDKVEIIHCHFCPVNEGA